MDPAPADPIPTKRRSPSMWTPEQARMFSVKAQEARRRYRAEAEYKKLHPPEPPQPLTPLSPAPDPFVARTLSRVRTQITRLIELLANEMDPGKADRLAAAIGRLGEIERQLADRPLPGSRRPAPEAPVSGIGAMMAARRQQPPPDGERRDQK